MRSGRRFSGAGDCKSQFADRDVWLPLRIEGELTALSLVTVCICGDE
jgi:hypothetical protein